MLKHIVFSNNPAPYKVAVLIKDKAMRYKDMIENYVTPLKARGFTEEEIVAFNLEYNQEDKAPAKPQLKEAV